MSDLSGYIECFIMWLQEWMERTENLSVTNESTPPLPSRAAKASKWFLCTFHRDWTTPNVKSKQFLTHYGALVQNVCCFFFFLFFFKCIHPGSQLTSLLCPFLYFPLSAVSTHTEGEEKIQVLLMVEGGRWVTLG